MGINMKSQVKKALEDFERGFSLARTTKTEVTPEEFEKRIRRMNKRFGLNYSQQYIDWAKGKLLDPNVSQEEKNLVATEVNPRVQKESAKLIKSSCATILMLIEFAYDELYDFVNDESKDANMRAFASFRLFLAAEAYQRARNLYTLGKYKKFDEPGALKPEVRFTKGGGSKIGRVKWRNGRRVTES